MVARPSRAPRRAICRSVRSTISCGDSARLRRGPGCPGPCPRPQADLSLNLSPRNRLRGAIWELEVHGRFTSCSAARGRVVHVPVRRPGCSDEPQAESARHVHHDDRLRVSIGPATLNWRLDFFLRSHVLVYFTNEPESGLSEAAAELIGSVTGPSGARHTPRPRATVTGKDSE
jgi:hypothetical protein